MKESTKRKYICVMSSTDQGPNKREINFNDWAIDVRKEVDSYFGITKDYKSAN